MNKSRGHCISCKKRLTVIDDDPDGYHNSTCAKCRAEEAHDYYADPDAEFDERGDRIEARRVTEERRVRDHKVPPAVVDFALEERKVLLAKIEYQDAVITQRNSEISRMWAEAEELRRDASRWQALLNCARIRLFGWAGYTNPDPYGQDPGNYRHFGADFWSIHPEDTELDRTRTTEILEGFADACVALSQLTKE